MADNGLPRLKGGLPYLRVAVTSAIEWNEGDGRDMTAITFEKWRAAFAEATLGSSRYGLVVACSP